MATFKEIVEAVEENNRMHDAQWKDWYSVIELQEAYGRLECDASIHAPLAFLNALIRDNGENLSIYLEAMECLEWGYSFAR